jgi:hypothetical protein
MAKLFLVVWLLPALWGAFCGWWRAARPAVSLRGFARDIGVAVVTAALPIFMFHMVWLGAFMEVTGGASKLGAWSSYWSALTALLWFPLLVIAYIIRATKLKKEAQDMG